MKIIRVNMAQIKRINVTSDNVLWFDKLCKANGVLLTMDAQPYVDMLMEFNVFFTLGDV